jgi:HAD superfamily hydrolase (TIGR01509 family)
MIKALLFDMDGLLLDTERVALAAYRSVAASMGLDMQMSGFRRLVGLNRRSGDAVFREIFPDVDADEFGARWDRLYHGNLRGDVPLRPRVVEMLSAIDLPKAVVTSSSRDGALDKLARAGIGDYFDILVGGDDVTDGKPHPEPYELGAARLGFGPHQCAAFEDSENGTRAAHAAGCVTVQIPDLFEPSAAMHALGHLIAPDLIAGARAVGLIK